jgi:cytoskeletal protein RodZ
MNVSYKSAFLALVAPLLLLVGTVALRAASSLQAPQSSDQSDSTAKSKQKKSDRDTPSPAKPAAASATKSSTPAATPPTPAPAKAAPSQQTPPANSSGMVWVNTDSGIYHKPGTRYYGKTKQGKYMTEADAIKAGYRAAGKK